MFMAPELQDGRHGGPERRRGIPQIRYGIQTDPRRLHLGSHRLAPGSHKGLRLEGVCGHRAAVGCPHHGRRRPTDLGRSCGNGTSGPRRFWSARLQTSRVLGHGPRLADVDGGSVHPDGAPDGGPLERRGEPAHLVPRCFSMPRRGTLEHGKAWDRAGPRRRALNRGGCGAEASPLLRRASRLSDLWSGVFRSARHTGALTTLQARTAARILSVT